MKTAKDVRTACTDEIFRLNARLEQIKVKRDLISGLENAIAKFERNGTVYVKTYAEEYIPTSNAQQEIRQIMIRDINEQILNRISEVETLLPGSTGVGDDKPEGRVLEL